MRVHETENGHKIAKPHTSARRNTRGAMVPFRRESVSGGEGSEGRATAAMRAVPGAYWRFYRDAPLVRAMVADSKVGRVVDGADVFQDCALAHLTGEDPRNGMMRALDRERKRGARGRGVVGDVREDEATTGDAEQALRDGLAEAVGLVWSSLTPKERFNVRRSMDGRPETLETVLGALRHAGFGRELDAVL